MLIAKLASTNSRHLLHHFWTPLPTTHFFSGSINSSNSNHYLQWIFKIVFSVCISSIHSRQKPLTICSELPDCVNVNPGGRVKVSKDNFLPQLNQFLTTFYNKKGVFFRLGNDSKLETPHCNSLWDYHTYYTMSFH